MKRPLTFFVVAIFTVSMALPAAAFAEVDRFAPEQTSAMLLTPQSLTAPQEASAPVLRDAFSSEIIKPAELASAYFPPIAGLLTMWPCNAPVNDGYGDRDGGFHYGIDIMCSYGTTVVAVAPGVVETVEEGAGSWGTYVKINHGSGVSTLCAHMIAGSPTVGVGQLVNAGDAIGAVGTTGNTTAAHCHFEVWVNGGRVNPQPWLP